MKKKHHPSKEKAAKMLRHGSVHGKPLTPTQKGFFGLLAGGKTPGQRMKEYLDK